MAEKQGIVTRGGEAVRHICDRFWLFTIAAIALMVIAVIVGAVVIHGKMPEGAGELLTAATTGLLMIVQKVIEAQSTRRLTDALHNSTPNEGRPTGQPNDPVHVEENQ